MATDVREKGGVSEGSRTIVKVTVIILILQQSSHKLIIPNIAVIILLLLIGSRGRGLRRGEHTLIIELIVAEIKGAA